MKLPVITALCLVCSCAFAAAPKPESLTVGEFFENPLGYSLDEPSLSWKLPFGADVRQSAYRVELRGDAGVVWDSGKVASSQSVKVALPVDIKSREKFSWRVKYWDGAGVESEWSDSANFEAGLLKNSDWKADWISSPLNPAETPVEMEIGGRKRAMKYRSVPPSYFRRGFEISKDVESARLYVASRGNFQAYINGAKVGDDYWGTGWTDYEIRVQSNSYDVSKLLRRGRNALGAILADGWRSGTQAWKYALKGGKDSLANWKPDMLLQLEIRYADGSSEIVASGADWKFANGEIVSADIYDGETCDMRKNLGEWKSSDFDDSAWVSASAQKLGTAPLVEPRRCRPIRITDAFEPLSSKKTPEGSWIFDFGQNMAGMVGLKIPALPEGARVKIRFAEMLREDGGMYTENYRGAKSTDNFISDGNSTEWTPVFTYHGFRYAEVSGLPADFVPAKDFAIACSMRTDAPMSGTFVCSSAKVNKLQNCIIWGQKSNFFSTPTDCPQRDERMGFLGDAQVFMPTALYNMNLDAFFAKWNVDISDAQRDDGVYPFFAPNLPGYHSPTSGWSDCGVICPWETYLAYADLKVLRRHYPNMKKWMDFQEKTAKDFIMPDKGIGDWLQPNPRDKTKKLGETIRPDAPNDLISTAYFVRTADIMRRAAEVLGETADAARFAKLAADIRMAFVAKYVKPDGEVFSDCQTVYLLALAYDIVEDKALAQKCFDRLVRRIELDERHLNTGFLGTPLLNPTLTRYGRSDLAYELLNTETYPSWLFTVEQGATTMWERWNSYSRDGGFGNAEMNSFNHYAYGAIGQWLYSTVGGLRLDESAPGYKNIIFAPKPDKSMAFAATSHETPYGLARSEWRAENGDMVWSVRIPSNSSGTLIFPTKDVGKVTLDGRPLSDFAKIEKTPDGFVSARFGAGLRHFRIKSCF